MRGSVLLDERSFDPDTHLFNIVGNSNEFERRNAVLTGAWAMLLNVVDRSGAGYLVAIAYRVEGDDADRRATPDLCSASAQP